MKTSLWGRLVAGVRSLLARLRGGQEVGGRILPNTVEELLTVLGQVQ